MNLARILPVVFNSLLNNKKKSVSALLALVLSYQAFSLEGLGSHLGIPSYDRFYKEPRDILVSRVELARSTQEETAEQFQSALEKFKSVTNFDGGDLEKQFNTLNKAFESSQAAADKISHRINLVVQASNELLEEWREELKQYHNPEIRQRAEQQFDQTRRQAQSLIAAMRQAEQKTKPVLGVFKDQVLFIKHNLNMQAISSLDKEAINLEKEVDALIRDMQNSITQANQFIETILSNK